MPDTIDAIMEQASRALVRMDYLACEALCLRALALARQGQDWPTYARVLLPLQESRRHRRMIAAEGAVRLGTSQLGQAPVGTAPSGGWGASGGGAEVAAAILQSLHPPVVTLPLAACVVITRPLLPETAAALIQFVRDQRHFIEVLYADNDSSAERWLLRSIAQPIVSSEIPAPPAAWRDKWSLPGTQAAEQLTPPGSPAGSPPDWFIDATEALGDAALRSVTAPLGSVERLLALEACLRVVTDHELIHQQLGDAARALSAKT